MTLAVTLLKVAGFIAFMLIVGKRLVPWIMQVVARLGSRELFTLTVVAAAVSIAFGAYKVLVYRWHWVHSSPGWWSKNPISATEQKKKPYLYVKFSPSYSLCQWECF